jgi:anti-sigma regulatory factor (Ser/Thr protein kinase)
MTVSPSQTDSGSRAVDPVEFALTDGAWAVRAASQWLVAAGRSLGVPPQPLHRLEVCLNELLANVIEHGGERARSLPVRLDLRSGSVAGPISPDGRASRNVLQGEATLTLSDGGIRFDPALHTPAGAPARLADARPGGLGLVMVRQLSDAFSHRRERDQNVVTVRVRWPKPTAGLHGG